MPTLIYSMSVSLDGYIAGPDGAIDWAAPDEELLRFHNEQTRELTGHLCGRRLYEDMLGWETAEQTQHRPAQPLQPGVGQFRLRFRARGMNHLKVPGQPGRELQQRRFARTGLTG